MGGSMNWERLTVETGDDGVVVVTLNRPPVNAFDGLMHDEIFAFFIDPDQAGEDVRAIVLRGGGKHFCAGNDLADFQTMTPRNAPDRMRRVRQALHAIQSCPVPVIASVHGVAVGTGVALIANCDFAIAAEDAKLGLPELNVGVMGGSRFLSRIAPEPLMRRMFFTAKIITAKEFRDAGGCIELAPSGTQFDVAMEHARTIAGHSPTGVRLAKKSVDHTEGLGPRHGYEIEQMATITMSGHDESKEAVNAFLEGRKATYRPANS